MSDLKITDGDDTVEFQLDAALAREAELLENLTQVEALLQPANDSYMKWRKQAEAAEQRNAALETAIRHTLDDSSEDAQTGEITIMQLDYETLATLIDEPTAGRIK